MSAVRKQYPAMPVQRVVTRPSIMVGQNTFTTREILRILNITDRTFANWREGKFPARRVLQVIHPDPTSNRFVVAEDELTAWLAEYRLDLWEVWRKERRHVSRAKG